MIDFQLDNACFGRLPLKSASSCIASAGKWTIASIEALGDWVITAIGMRILNKAGWQTFLNKRVKELDREISELRPY